MPGRSASTRWRSCGCRWRRPTWSRWAAPSPRTPEVAFAAATTGPTNLVATVVCRDVQALYRYLTERLGTLPAIRHVESAPIIRTVKSAGS
ncbi:Lrp/AsnC ligand binding domain-containing protein [Phytohabitans rumicis]|uniref:Lrp/AsnC ligand binding domain-containing protein n=1 Tax=Phytohabitans rumicis TaxID=1076125 RepID=UPI002483B029|nr:Lrp/AsnC ligand binding domain-containing protein [Phytohabitans rumicis]